MFGNAAMVEKKHVIAEIGDRSQVMGDENISQSQLFLQFTQKVHDLDLGVGIQGGDGFVKENDLRLAGHSPGNADTLQLSAG